jgi:hypothetical protein
MTAKSRRLGDESIVLGVIANPEPQDRTLDLNAEGAMAKADPARPEPPHTFEMERRVMGLALRS